MEIKVYATLRSIVGSKSVHLQGISETTVGQLIEELLTRYPDMQAKLMTREGEFHSAFHFLINGRNMYYLNGMETVVTAADDIRIFPPVGGGI